MSRFRSIPLLCILLIALVELVSARGATLDTSVAQKKRGWTPRVRSAVPTPAIPKPDSKATGKRVLLQILTPSDLEEFRRARMPGVHYPILWEKRPRREVYHPDGLVLEYSHEGLDFAIQEALADRFPNWEFVELSQMHDFQIQLIVIEIVYEPTYVTYRSRLRMIDLRRWGGWPDVGIYEATTTSRGIVGLEESVVTNVEKWCSSSELRDE